ncbi:MAG: prepilin-type N-terminal cleavage/methylation domain-containing protein [Candidatus Omnitrophota bacterium]
MHINKRGVTLIEAIAVLIIMVILAVAASVKMGPYDTIKLEGAAQKIADDIRYAQMRAMQEAVNTDGTRLGYRLRFQTASDYECYYVQSAKFKNSDGSFLGSVLIITDPFSGEPESYMTDFLSDSIYRGIDINEIKFTASPCETCFLVFYGNLGIPYVTNAISDNNKLAVTGSIKLSYKGQNRYICVMPEIGTACIKRTGDCSSGCP